jgi:hypothetical protein
LRKTRKGRNERSSKCNDGMVASSNDDAMLWLKGNQMPTYNDLQTEMTNMLIKEKDPTKASNSDLLFITPDGNILEFKEIYYKGLENQVLIELKKYRA